MPKPVKQETTYLPPPPLDQWDSSGDGGIDHTDFLAKFDIDGDGKLGKGELDALGTKLSEQLDMNNQLLTQIQRMEEAKLAASKELQNVQGRLSRLLSSNAEMKEELNETKRKLKVSQEIVDNTTRQARDSRTESIALRQELEICKKQFEELKASSRDYLDEKFRLERQVKEQSNQVNLHKETLERSSSLLKSDITALTKSNQDLNAALSDMKKKITPLTIENKELKAELDELSRAHENLSSNHDMEHQERIASDKNMREAMAQLEQTRIELSNTKFELNSAKQKEDDVVRRSKEVERQQELLITRINASEKEVSELHLRIDQMQVEKDGLQHEINSMQSDLDALTLQRQNENDIWAEKYVSLQAEMVNIQEEAKKRYNAALADAKQRISAAIEDRKTAEESLHASQESVIGLHDAMESMRKDHEASIEEWKECKTQLEDLILSVRRQSSGKDAEIERMHVAASKEREEHRKEINKYKTENAEKTKGFAEAMNTIQSMLTEIKKDWTENQEQFREIENQIQLMRRFVSQLKEKVWTNPIRKMQPELEKTFDILFGKLQDTRDANEVLRDDIATLQVSLEEERARSLLCEEELSKLEHQLSSSTLEKNNELDRVKEDLEAMRNELKDAADERAEMQSRYARIQASFDATSKQNKELLLTNQKLQTAMRDSASSRSEAIAMNNIDSEKVEKMKASLAECQREKKAATQVTENLKAEIISLREASTPLRKENASLKSQLKKKDEDFASKMEQSSTAMIKLQQTATQYARQLKSTQDILKNVQTQRISLEDQNSNLLKELEKVYADKEKEDRLDE